MRSTVPERPASRERVEQKARTRQALLRAARELVAAGGSPSVAEVADAAHISRATAYRYFPSQQALLGESAMFLLGDERLLSPAVFDDPAAPTDVEDRVALVADTMYDFYRDREAQFRHYLPTQLALGLESSSDRRPVRPAFRVPLIDRALEPVAAELSADQLRRLRHGIALLTAPESLIVARDVLHLEHDDARDELAWACRALVRAARADSQGLTPGSHLPVPAHGKGRDPAK